jgi:hypothetical protein
MQESDPYATLPQEKNEEMDKLFEGLAKLGQTMQERVTKEQTNRERVRALLSPHA